MNKFLITLLLFFTLPRISNGQTKDKVDSPVTHNVFNRVLNNAFNKLVSSNPNAGEIANYASIDPINASFSVKGSIPIQPGRKKMLKSKTLSFEDKLRYDHAKISYLSFSASGNLIDKSYGTLFSNSSLNTGVSLAAQYNFRVGKAKFSYGLEEYTNFTVKEKILFQKYAANKITLENSLTDKELQRAKRLLELNKISLITKLQKNRTETALVQKSVDSLGNNINQRPGLVDTLQKSLQDGLVLQKTYDGTQASLDSISAVGNYTSNFLVLEKDKLRNKLKNDYNALVSELPIMKIRLTWFSLIGGYGRKSYNTFDTSLPFESQFDKGKQDAWNWGVAVNRLLLDSLQRRTLFFNLTILRSRNNNLALLSTSDIEQTRTIVNSAGDTTRTLTNKISAYTQPVNCFKLWNVSFHGYYIFGKTPSGIHVFPSLDFPDKDAMITNLTLGYIIPFLNTLKDQPVINAELYVRFNDMFNEADLDNKFYNRNEIGISFTIPFKIF